MNIIRLCNFHNKEKESKNLNKPNLPKLEVEIEQALKRLAFFYVYSQILIMNYKEVIEYTLTK